MKQGKADLSQLFKNGKDFQFKAIDYSKDKKVIKDLEKLRKKQREIMESTKVDFEELRKIVFYPIIQ